MTRICISDPVDDFFRGGYLDDCYTESGIVWSIINILYKPFAKYVFIK